MRVRTTTVMAIQVEFMAYFSKILKAAGEFCPSLIPFELGRALRPSSARRCGFRRSRTVIPIHIGQVFRGCSVGFGVCHSRGGWNDVRPEHEMFQSHRCHV
jgi:hypothetical protein